MKLLIATRADENIKEMTDLTFPVLKNYAKKCGADFLAMDHLADCKGNGKFHYRIMKFFELYEKYDRILSLDSDILVTSNCPNLFDVVPETKIGTVYEDKGTRSNDRKNRIKLAQNKFGKIGWKNGYINTGVFITSKCHRDIFQKINSEYYDGFGFDDVHLGYLINKHKFPVHELSYKFNHMTMFSEPWNKSADRFESNIIHYAGVRGFDNNLTQIQQIKLDLQKLYPNGLN